MNYNLLESGIEKIINQEDKNLIKKEIRSLKNDYGCIKYNAASLIALYSLGTRFEEPLNAPGFAAYMTIAFSFVTLMLYLDNYRDYKKIEKTINNLKN